LSAIGENKMETANSDALEVSTGFDVTDTIQRTGKGGKVSLTYELRQPTLPELKEKESQQPYRSMNMGEEEQVLSDLSGKAEAQLFDKLVVSTAGYKLNVQSGQTEEDRKTAIKGIPPRHKTDIVRAVLAVDAKVIYDEDLATETFIWSEDQEYRVRTEIGDTGNFVAYFMMKELSQRQLEKYNGATKMFLERGAKKPITRITVDLAPGVELFDKTAMSVEGLTVKGIMLDVKNPEHLAKIPPHIKRAVVDAVVAETHLELGN
jgi:hypothetical protein